MVKSQGADYATWLTQNPRPDTAFHTRQRMNLNELVRLPPADGKTFQGLSFDLKGLATCLELLPLCKVLNLPASAGTNAGQRDNEDQAQSVQSGDGDVLSNIEEKRAEGAAAEPREAEVPANAPAVPASTAAQKPLHQALGGIYGDRNAQMIGRTAAIDEEDDLDELLGLSKGTVAAAAAGRQQVASAANIDAGTEDSLEDWLDKL